MMSRVLEKPSRRTYQPLLTDRYVLVTTVATLVAVLLLAVIVVETWTLTSDSLASGIDLHLDIDLASAVGVALVALVLGVAVALAYKVTQAVSCTMLLYRGRFVALARRTVRLAAALPIPVLGFATLECLDHVGLVDVSWLSIGALALTLITPTAASLSVTSADPSDLAPVVPALALGVSRPYVSRHLLRRSLRRHTIVAFCFGASRVAIETAIVAATALTDRDEARTLTVDGVAEAARSIYSLQSLDSNPALLVSIFAVVLLFNGVAVYFGATR
jgi:hypothetical protein